MKNITKSLFNVAKSGTKLYNFSTSKIQYGYDNFGEISPFGKFDPNEVELNKELFNSEVDLLKTSYLAFKTVTVDIQSLVFD